MSNTKTEKKLKEGFEGIDKFKRIEDKDPTVGLSRGELRKLVDLQKQPGWEILYQLIEKYVRGPALDELLSAKSNVAQFHAFMQGLTVGSRWVVDQPIKADRELKRRKKQDGQSIDKREGG
jgi:hypothetical protein